MAAQAARVGPRRLAPDKLAIGIAITGVILMLGLVSLVWTPDPPTRMHIGLRLRPPFAAGPLGTDQFGRDVLSMLMVGARNSLVVAVLSVGLGGTLGTLLGVTAAIRRGFVEAVAMRGCDVIFAFPPIMSAMMLGSLAGAGQGVAILAIAVFMVPVFARVTRGAALRVWGRDFILAARGAGKPAWLIAVEHVLPNIAGPIIVQATLQLGLAILTEAGLSFLGLGAPPPAPSWGRMLADAQTYLAPAPWLVVAPGAAVAFAVLGFNLLGDGLRDRLDRRASVRR